MDTHLDQSASSSTLETILARAAQTLGSIEAPDYRRIKFNARRYARLILELSASFWIRDISDGNEDVSSVLLLCSERVDTECYVVYISNIADYAFAINIGERHQSDQYLDIAIDVLKRAGLEHLSHDIVSADISTTTFISDKPCLFNLLFSDTEYLPWELSDNDRSAEEVNHGR